MKKKNIFIFLMLIVSVLLIYFVYKKIGAREIWLSLLSFSPKGILVVLVIMILSHLIGVWRWKTILEDRGYNFGFKNLIGPWLAGFGVGFFAPFAFLGGETMRAYTLKKGKSITWKKSFVSILIDKIFEGTTSFLILFLGIIFLILSSLAVPLRLLMFFLVLLIPIGGIIFFYVKAFNSQSLAKIIEKPLTKFLSHRVKSVFALEKEIFEFFNRKNKNMIKSAGIALLRQAVDVLRCWAMLFFMGEKIGFLPSILIMGLVYLSVYTSPIPAALGTFELIGIFIFSLLGLSIQAGVAFVLLYRSFDFLFAIGGILVSFKVILQWFKEKLLEMPEEENNNS